MLPFNIELMTLSKQRLASLKPVRVSEPYEGATENFHEDGLYSVSIFGRVGDEKRDRTFSYIELNTEILHPIIYLRLARLKGLYKDIMAGKRYAIFDEKEKDFLPSNEVDGSTGYSYFLEHWQKIKFKETKSTVRRERIALIEKYRDRALCSQILVLPAGLRDLEVDETGRKREDDINDLYRRVIRISNSIGFSTSSSNKRVLDNPRHSLQLTFNEIYKTLENLLTGKKGFIQSKWGSRRIQHGTRNVITAMDTSAKSLTLPNRAKFTDTELGLYQTIKGALPLAVHHIMNGFLSDVLVGGEMTARLVDKQSLRSETVRLSKNSYDRWATEEGIAKVIGAFEEPHTRHQPVDIDGYYVGLIFLGEDQSIPGETTKTFALFNGVEELPADSMVMEGGKFTGEVELSTHHKGRVEPITLCQLVYLSGYQVWNKLKVFVTRYPVAGLGSIYASNVYVRTTIEAEVRRELDLDFQPKSGDEYLALEFPNTEGKNDYMDSQVVHPTRLAGLSGDYDGDKVSGNIVYTDDAIEEINKKMNSKEMWLDPNGGFKASTSYDTVNFVLRNITG